MLLNTIDKKIRKAFSNAAVQYEVLAGLQNEIGRELVRKIDLPDVCSNVLDVGMGTGRVTHRLHLLLPEAKVIGIDFAYGMALTAKEKYEELTFLQADAMSLPFKADTFDVVASNAAYHWVGNLPAALKQVFSILKNDGQLCATLFGQGTLRELFASLESARPSSLKPLDIQRLPSKPEVEQALEMAGFKNIEVQSEIIKTHFDDLFTLVKWLKDIGANKIQRDFFVGRACLLKANEYYQKNFKDAWGVYATFEVIWVKARKGT